jgi:hypothetical protein
MHVPIRRDTDVVVACQKGRIPAAQLGLPSDDQVIVVIASFNALAGTMTWLGVGNVKGPLLYATYTTSSSAT